MLGTKDHEALLSSSFQEHIKALNAQLGEKDGPYSNEKADGGDKIGYAEFDFHREIRNAGGIESVRDLINRHALLGGTMDGFGYCLAAIDGKDRATFLNRQEGVYRTNCLDCLERVSIYCSTYQIWLNALTLGSRTNVVQDILSRLALEHYLRSLVPTWTSSEILTSAHRTLWAEVSFVGCE